MTNRVLVLAILCLLAACEDGPTQTFKATPAGAAQRWNDGKTPAVVDNSASQGFQTDFAGGANKQEICTGEKRHARWAAMVKEPIIPPFQAAGIVGVGADTDPAGKVTINWKGLTVEDAEKTNCQSESIGDNFGDGTQVNVWGDNGEVWIKYDVANHNKISWISVFAGYEGNLVFTSRDKKDKFVIHLGTQIAKNDKPFELDWNSKTKFAAQATELADALFATYAPEMPAEDIAKGTCITSGRCTQTMFGGADGALRIWPLGVHLWVASNSAAQPAPSKFTRIDLRLPRIMPYTFGSPLMKLDAAGPTTKVSYPGADGCDPRLGMTWQEFSAKCVKITGDATKDQLWLSKLTGNITHDSETYVFDTSGVDLEFQSTALAKFDVLRDADRPVDGDVASSVVLDANTLGTFQNDTGPDGKTLDLHGSGAVYFEFARLVQEEINHQLKLADANAKTHELGDPACLFPDDMSAFDPAGFQYDTNCTGFEGFVTAMPAVVTATAPGAPIWPANRLRLGGAAIVAAAAQEQTIGQLTLGLKPGKPIAAFCMDANGDASGGPNSGYQYCGTNDNYGMQGALWDTAFQRVRLVLGKGDLHKLPLELRDRRFFFRMYVIALLKYLTVAGDPTKLELANIAIDPNDMFFDSEGAGQYEFAEYIDRRFVSATQAPLDLLVKADILNGTFFDYKFERTMLRDEAAMYASVTEKPGDPLGKENDLTLTSIFGSTVLASGWTDHKSKSAYECASADWKTAAEYEKVLSDCDGERPPLDPAYVPDPQDAKAPPVLPLREGGKPILTPYKGAFTGRGTVFSLGSTALEIEATFPDLQAAKVNIHRTKDPYGPGSAAATPLEVLVEPWAPPQPGYGFLWPINGQQDKVVTAGVLDFSGVTTSFAVSYFTTKDSKADGSGPISVVAVDTSDYLGDVFLCQDVKTGDLLRVRMYGSVQTMLDWIDSHPGVYDSCGLIVRYSPYNNYPDYIISTVNGVRVSVTQGGGFGRVNEASMWLPGQY